MNHKLKVSLLCATTIFILVLSIVSGLSFGSHVDAAESDYALNGKYFTVQGGKEFHGVKEGCTYEIPLNELAVAKVTRVVYDIVKLQSQFDTVVTDGEGKYTGKYEFLKEKVEVKASDFSIYDKPTFNKTKYFTVKATEWCAFVFQVYYSSAQGEEVTYDSSILYARTIDTSLPEIYYTDWVYDSGKYVFDMVIRGNKRNAERTSDSLLEKFTVKKVVNGETTVTDEVKDIQSAFYNYTLRVGTEKAKYIIEARDYANNVLAKDVVEFTETSYDKGFEVAMNNLLVRLEKDLSYSRMLYNELQKAFYDYYLVIQDSASTDTKKRSAMDKVYAVSKKIAKIDELKAEGKKDFELKLFNSEYLSGAVELRNLGRAYGDLKYGDKAVVNLSVALFDPKTVERKKQMAAVGLTKAKQVYSFTLRIDNNAEDTPVEVKFGELLEIRLPFSNGKKIKAVQTVRTSDGETIHPCAVTTVSDSVIVYVPYSYGSIDVFVGGGADLRWLWLLMILPVGAGAAAGVILVKKRKGVKKIDTDDNK